MKKNDFNLFYDNVIKKLAIQLSNDFSEFEYCDNMYGLYEEYLSQRNLMRLFYNKKETLLDRHKVCACMTVAIMKVRLLNGGVEDDGDTSLRAPRVNEQLAFMSAWELFISFLRAEGRENVERYSFPETFHNYFFLDTITRSLFVSNQMNMLSTPLIANIFFLMERYCEIKNE